MTTTTKTSILVGSTDPQKFIPIDSDPSLHLRSRWLVVDEEREGWAIALAPRWLLLGDGREVIYNDHGKALDALDALGGPSADRGVWPLLGQGMVIARVCDPDGGVRLVHAFESGEQARAEILGLVYDAQREDGGACDDLHATITISGWATLG